jgi:hypothetical protein
MRQSKSGVTRTGVARLLAEGDFTWFTRAITVAFEPLNYFLRRLSQSGFRRTLAGGHWAWGALGLAAFMLRRARQPAPDVRVVRMSPGDRFVIGLAPRDGAPDGSRRS